MLICASGANSLRALETNARTLEPKSLPPSLWNCLTWSNWTLFASVLGFSEYGNKNCLVLLVPARGIPHSGSPNFHERYFPEEGFDCTRPVLERYSLGLKLALGCFQPRADARFLSLLEPLRRFRSTCLGLRHSCECV